MVTGVIARYYYWVTVSGIGISRAVLLPTLPEASLLCILGSGTDRTYLLGRVPTDGVTGSSHCPALVLPADGLEDATWGLWALFKWR